MAMSQGIAQYLARKSFFNYSSLLSSRMGRKETSESLVMSSVPASKGLAEFINIFDIQWECVKENVMEYTLLQKPQKK